MVGMYGISSQDVGRKPRERLEAYLWCYSACRHSSKWKGGPGQVVLNAPPEHREEFSRLRSDDIANPADPYLAALMAMSPEDSARESLREEVHRLLGQFDRELERHRKFSVPE